MSVDRPVDDVPASGFGAWRRRHPALAEVVLLAGLYCAYSVIRSFSGDERIEARENALRILRLQADLQLDFEASLNRWALGSHGGSIAASFFYASGHFVVTGLLLVLLFRYRRSVYPRLRTTLIAATAGALVLYLVLPTAPPRLFGRPYVDMLAVTADHGWWGANASAPKGMGGFTNELAAFPSMHAGWSLWVAIAVFVATHRWWLRALAVGYAALTAFVVVITANHWTLDIIAGWAVMGAAAALCLRWGRTRTPAREPLLVATGGQLEA